MKKFFLFFTTIFALILTTSNIFCFVLANRNFEYNSNYWNSLNYEGLIYDQFDYKELKFGVGNIGANGCGAVAIYNILVLEGKYKPFPEIIKYFDNSKENFFGLLGTNPYYMIKYLKHEGYNAKYTFNTSKFYDYAKESKYSILLTVNFQSGHYELIYDFNENTQEFSIINSIWQYNTMENVLKFYKNKLKILIYID